MTIRIQNIVARHVILLMCVWGMLGCQDAAPPVVEPTRTKPAGKRHGTTIVSARSLGTFEVQDPVTGKPQSIECATCHGIKRQPGELVPESMHKALVMKHGNNTCNACHSDGDRSTLHLADGQVIPFADTMKLCAQCHGPQYRDYQHGSHGGMSGYWDTSKGGRVRNHCVNCHDPHAPAFPQMKPAPGPRDRFMSPGHHPTKPKAH